MHVERAVVRHRIAGADERVVSVDDDGEVVLPDVRQLVDSVLGWMTVNVAVVTVVLTGIDASQRVTSAKADETTAIDATAATATARMIFFTSESSFDFRQSR